MSFFEIFNPGERFMREEKDSRKMLVAKPTPGGGAPLGIDLDGGKATITIRISSSTTDSEAAKAESPPEESDSGEQPDEPLEQDAPDVADSPDSPEAAESPDAADSRPTGDSRQTEATSS